MSENPVLVDIDTRGVATVTLNRPELHNAFDENLIRLLTEAFARLGTDPAVRIVVVAGAGTSFSAGGDLSWMQRMAGYGEAENFADAMGLAGLYRTLDTSPKPTVALVHGAAFAGGVGLIAACDIALAAEEAFFAISEARLGLVPATISPYIVGAMSARAARRYFLTGERFSAAEALRLGLIHKVVPKVDLAAALEQILGGLFACAPLAQAESKRMIADVRDRPIDEALVAMTARRIAKIRSGEEARDGLAAFFEKRKPRWHR
jgi:methylglutaconyl-CoA hydratase